LAAALFSVGIRRARAYPLGLQPGLQLWSVKDALEADQAGTFRKLAQIGFRELELYELPKSPLEMKKQCADLGLTMTGSHIYLQQLKDRKTIDTALQLGLQYLIITFPTLRSIPDKDVSNMSVRELTPMYEKITPDDYKWNAEQFNRNGAALKREGLQLGYHTHALDFKVFNGMTTISILIEATDPALVVYELDCGHAIHAGSDPIALLRKYPTRIQLLHLKDLKAGYGLSSSIDTEEKDTNAELGSGVIDWRALFAVAARGNVKHYFVEHEGHMGHPPLEAVANSLQYLKLLAVT
jgi:sugar phosphate isomerase/epimerase